jgi:hypothetical protein
VLRLTPNERIQHAVLAITFVILAYTGFALKFQDAWWAGAFNLAEGEDAGGTGMGRWKPMRGLAWFTGRLRRKGSSAKKDADARFTLIGTQRARRR